MPRYKPVDYAQGQFIPIQFEHSFSVSVSALPRRVGTSRFTGSRSIISLDYQEAQIQEQPLMLEPAR